MGKKIEAIHREIDRVECSCGGEVFDVRPLAKEERTYGCNRRNCCVRAWQCDRCKTRFTLALCAPERSE